MNNNQVTLIGNMGERLNVSDLNNGSKVARFNMVTTTSVKGKVNFQWYQLFCFGNLAQFIADFGGKGKKIVVTGKLVNRTFVSRTGEQKKISEIEVRHVVGL
ncbi:MAG: single-stranded DNA-binding protein [Flavobacteriia bacterium]|nr:single-stranded DNA-binding protein [Flavobacteriia bacterium]OJX39801.1 MAG: hypothetical protein BGO87_02260 [Flavobacteriia bacterium 40-80]